jgi:hypothetical protein
MKTLFLLAFSLIASQAHAAPTACLAAAQSKGNVTYQCVSRETDQTVMVSEDSNSALTLTYCANLNSGIESGVVAKSVTSRRTKYATLNEVDGDATYSLITNRRGSHFMKRSDSDSIDLDMTCGMVGSL